MRTSRTAAVIVTAALAMTGLATTAAATPAQPAAPSAVASAAAVEDGLIAHYLLDETAGTVAADSSGNGNNGTVDGAATWNGGDGFTFSGGANGSGNAIELPDNLVAGKDDVTVDFDVWVDPTLSGNWFMFNIGNQADWPNGTGYLFVTGRDSGGSYRATIAPTNYASEQSASRTGGLATGMWKHVTYVVDGGTTATPGASRLYEDGALVASNNALTTSPAVLGTPAGSTTRNYLGRSAYPGDLSFKGQIRDFRLYDRTLTAAEIAELADDTNSATLAADTAALTLGDISHVTDDLTLPTVGASGTSTITWATDRCDIIGADGAVFPPEDAVDVVLTATLTRGSSSVTKEFTAHVAAAAGEVENVAEAVAAGIFVPNVDDVRGNLTLPTDGTACSTIAWTSSDPAVITTTGEVDRPAYGEAAEEVTLTATVTHGSNEAVRVFDADVPALPQPAAKEAYLFTYFVGESTDAGEKIYFGASKGNNALQWDDLNNGDPVLTSTMGTTGLRDPFIIRSPEGDKFYLLATDLKIYPGGSFSTAQQSGSTYLEIWESTDLVNWSDQRHIKVSSDYAGNTWAPEAYYDDASGSYVVYWASNLYPTTTIPGRDFRTTYNRMMMVTTRDFVTFSDPTPWVDVKRGTGLGIIDATVIKDGDTFYRFEKDEASMTVRQEKSTDLLATVSGGLPTTTSTPGWQLIKERVGVGQPNPWGGTVTQVEGPLVFKANEGDVNTAGLDTWFLFMDQPSYHGGQGYVPFTSTDLDSGDWTSEAETSHLPTSPRHGTVLPVSQAEYDALLNKYQKSLLVTAIDPVTVRTREGVAPVMPATVNVHYANGSSKAVAVDWGTIDPAEYATTGTFTVSVAPVPGSPIEAVATVTVTDPADPVVTLTSTPANPDGLAGWFVTPTVPVKATATDDRTVTSVDTALDGGGWASTAGSIATVTVTGDGTHTVQARASDASGNVSTPVSTQIKIDSTDPVSKALVDEAARKVTLVADDSTSGLAKVEYRIGTSGAWLTYSTPVTVSGTAATTVQYRSVDTAGNVEITNSAVVPTKGVELRPTATAAVITPTVVKYGTKSKVTVKVTGTGGIPTGTVKVTRGSTLVGTGTLKAGKAIITVSGTVPVGRNTLKVSYGGNAVFAASSDTVTLTVTKAASATKVSVSPARITTSTKPTVKIAVSSPTTAVNGKATVVVTRTSSPRGTVVARTVNLVGGKASLTLPKQRMGSYRVAVTYQGSTTVTTSKAGATFTVR